MSFQKQLILAAIIAMGAPIATFAQGNGNDRQTVCERNASTMRQACVYDALDDHSEAVANCRNIADRDDRHDCFADAGEEAFDEFESCGDVQEAREEACDLLGEKRYDPDPLLDSSITFIDPDEVPGSRPVNPYVSVAAGHTYVLNVTEEGELAEKVVVHVTEESREILGVLCRVVVDIVVEESIEDGEVEYEPVEVTDDWFAQDDMSNVYYCGEVARNYEDGVLRDLDGSFEAGFESAKAGVLVRSMPVPGEAHRQEFALGEAEDIVQYMEIAATPTGEEGGDNPLFPCNNNCLKTFDFAPIEPESTEYKYYLPGVGFVLAVGLEDGEITGEREELVCVGDSLDVLNEPACGFQEPALLLEELCKLSPDAFCED